ncbi:MAG TPA: phosphatidylglycerophosphatase A [Myxococcota bacterium]|nr:phosphatidylglycerophosphatase A [Myxococcota bacterium]
MTRQGLVHLIALRLADFFYVGRSPFAPGTMGSLVSLVIWAPALYCGWPLYIKLVLLVALFFIGVWAAGVGIVHYRQVDPKQVVIDEVVGQGIPFLLIAPTIFQMLLAFALFRLFDIVKPWPIKAIERRYQDKWGLMLDDVAAGILAAGVIFVCQSISLF